MTKNNRRLDVVAVTKRPGHGGMVCGARQKTDSAEQHFEIPDEALAELREDLMARRVGRGVEWFGEHRSVLREINPDHRNTALLIGYLSQWVGLCDWAPDTVRELLSLFPPSLRSQLPLDCYVHLKLTDGVLTLADGEPEIAATHFDFIIALQQEPIDQGLAALAYFWKALCERKRGKWDSALTNAERARTIALGIRRVPAAAMMQALEGSLNVQKGRFSRAMELLREADEVLQQTDDFEWLGNIQAALGQIAIEEGRYESALDHFAKAVAYYEERSTRQSNLPQSLASLAHCQRLIALRIAKAIDTNTERRRRSGPDASGPSNPDARQDVEQLREEALTNLTDVIERFRSLGEFGGLSLARVERGFVLIDCGHFDRAVLDADEAFAVGCKIKDPTAMASARLLHSRIESAQYEEGIGDAPTQLAQRAHDFARDALTYARQTEDRRLLASAYLCQGQVFCNDFFNNPEAADECCRQAAEFLTPGNRNQLWEEHQALAKKIAGTASVDARLREWSLGLVGGKTFQQMIEEFADVVIPGVWEREGRNVSRVVAKLSISPKKVRRILCRAGLKTVSD